MGRPGRRLVVALLAGSIPALAGALAGQEPAPEETAGGRLLEARLRADLGSLVRVGGGGPALPVTLEYRLEPAGEGHVPLAALDFGEARVVGLRARLGGATPGQTAPPGAAPSEGGSAGEDELPVRRVEGPAGRARWEIELTSDLPERITVTVSWLVTGGVDEAGPELSVVVPIPALLWAPAEPLPGTFVARVAAGPGARIMEAFPTTFVSQPREDGSVLLEGELPVLPSVLRLRLDREGGMAVRPVRLLDGAVAALFLALALFGGLRLARGGAGSGGPVGGSDRPARAPGPGR